MSGENCMQVASVDAATSRRLLSIDVFRGFDMMMIVGIDAIMKALDAWISGSPGWLTAQFSHPEWFGLSFYDTIFPTFIFIAGMSFPFSPGCAAIPRKIWCRRRQTLTICDSDYHFPQQIRSLKLMMKGGGFHDGSKRNHRY